ncbi:MAG: lipoprotein-releasing ABC transporter ATP-binding protein LolD [Candidatus Sumerlaeia bacterium]
MQPLVHIQNLHKSYRDATRTIHVLSGVSLSIHRGEAVAIVGASGAGKSTLLHLVGALDRADRGDVVFDGGAAYSQMNERELAALRNARLGFIYQFHYLLEEFTALENVMMPALIAGAKRPRAAQAAAALLKRVGLGERLDHRPSKLSGGEQQRVALARALINEPDLVLADEPTGNLDLQTGEDVINVIWDVTVRNNKALLIVTHDLDIARRAARTFRLRGGKLHPEQLNQTK